MALNMNQLAATTLPADDDIMHVRNTSGIDVKITWANLRYGIVSYDEKSSNFTTTESTENEGKIQVFHNTHTANITATLGTSGKSVIMPAGITIAVVYNGTTWYDLEWHIPRIGFTYIQLYNEPTPATLWGGTWSNVSSSYPGRFLRPEGGGAAAWGSTQTDQNKSHVHKYHDYIDTTDLWSIQVNNGSSGNEANSRTYNSAGSAVQVPVIRTDKLNDAWTAVENAAGTSEARPDNTTVRLWKRTA
jgi:hypothetical protein